MTLDWAVVAHGIVGREDLPIPRLEVPGLGRTPRGTAMALDGDSYFVWADGARWGGGAHAAMTADAAPAHAC